MGCGSAQKPHYRQFIEFASDVLVSQVLPQGAVPRRIKTNTKNIQKKTMTSENNSSIA
jgi:hypothetical protein